MGKRTPLGTLTPVSSQSAVHFLTCFAQSAHLDSEFLRRVNLAPPRFVLKEKRVYF
jgi:hypothetical protein